MWPHSYGRHIPCAHTSSQHDTPYTIPHDHMLRTTDWSDTARTPCHSTHHKCPVTPHHKRPVTPHTTSTLSLHTPQAPCHSTHHKRPVTPHTTSTLSLHTPQAPCHSSHTRSTPHHSPHHKHTQSHHTLQLTLSRCCTREYT